METHDERFIRRLRESVDAVFAVARYFNLKGFDIQIPRYRERPTAAQWRKYTDEGDLFVKSEQDPEFKKIDVKHRKIDFTCEEDFPFEDILIGAKRAYDDMDEMPWFIAVVNKQMTHSAFIPCSKSDLWYVSKVSDSFGETTVSMAVPRSIVVWRELNVFD